MRCFLPFKFDRSNRIALLAFVFQDRGLFDTLEEAGT
jgi:hypothetical protein